MIRSLSLKLAMLAVTMGMVFWIGWQPREFQLNGSESVDMLSGTKHLSLADALPTATPASQPNSGSTPIAPGDSNPVGTPSHQVSNLVDLNRATVDELESLPGIGTVLAQRVIAYRTSMGRFQAVEDLREVKGIGSKKFDQIKPLVTVATGEPKGKTEKRTS